jgi:valyl-tRNA synthetase
MPFITEELWLRLPGVGRESFHPAYRGADVTPTVMLTEYPRADESLINERAESEMQALIELVSRVRNIRTELNVKPGDQLPRIFVGAPDRDTRLAFANGVAQIARLTRASQIFISDRLPSGNGDRAGAPELPSPLSEVVGEVETVPRASARAALSGGVEVAVPLEGLIDFEKERERIARETEKLEKEGQKLEGQLANPQFVERAPAEKVEELRQRLGDVRQRIRALGQMREALAE